MKKIYSLLIVVLLVFTNTNAQQITIHGFLKDSVTHYPIAGGTITNVKSSKKVTSNEKGYFQIEAAPNDFLFILAKSYKYDTLTFSFLFTDTISVYLRPAANVLPDVFVRAQYSKYQSDSIERRAAFEAGLGPRMKSFSAPNTSGFGVALNLDKIFKQQYKGKKKSTDLFENLENSAYIDYRFSPQLVAYYTSLKGDTLRLFMQQYTPDYNWLRKHPTNEDVLYYINDKLKTFRMEGKL